MTYFCDHREDCSVSWCSYRRGRELPPYSYPYLFKICTYPSLSKGKSVKATISILPNHFLGLMKKAMEKK